MNYLWWSAYSPLCGDLGGAGESPHGRACLVLLKEGCKCKSSVMLRHLAPWVSASKNPDAVLRQSAEPFLGTPATSKKPQRPRICVLPARVEQEGMVRRGHGEKRQLEGNKPNPQTPFC